MADEHQRSYRQTCSLGSLTATPRFEGIYRLGTSNENANAHSRILFPSINGIAIDTPGIQTFTLCYLNRDPGLKNLIGYPESHALPNEDPTARTLLLNIDDFYHNDDGLLSHHWHPVKRQAVLLHSQLVFPSSLRHEVLTHAHDDPTGTLLNL